MKMDADVVVTTLGDLDNFYIKRSYVRDDIEYVYMFHHTTSMDMTSTVGEYDNYDTLLCTGPHQIEEMRQIEEIRGIKRKNLVGAGYDLIDREIADYDNRISKIGGQGEKPTILLAPSWQEDNLLDCCVDDLIQSVLGTASWCDRTRSTRSGTARGGMRSNRDMPTGPRRSCTSRRTSRPTTPSCSQTCW